METQPTLALSDALNFTPLRPAVASRATRVVINPISQGAQYPGSVVKFDLPCGTGARYLDCSETCLQFTIQNTDPTAAQSLALDGSAYCFLNRLDVISSGQIVETIQSYNVLANTLLDIQMGAATAFTSGSIAYGMASPSSNNVDRTGLSIPTNGVADFNIPVMSGVIGSSCKKLLPIHALGDLRAEFTLESLVQSVVSASATANWTMINPVLICTYVDLDPEMHRSIQAKSGGEYLLSTSSWRSFNSTLIAGRSQDSVIIPARFSSVSMIANVFRDIPHLNVLADLGLTARSNPFASTTGVQCQLQYAIGGALYPQSAVRNGISEMWATTQTAFHQVDDVNNPSRCTLANWSGPVYSATVPGTFVTALNFCSFIGKTSTMTSGISTMSTPVVLNLTYPAAVTPSQRIDSFVCYDAIMKINENGLLMMF